MLRAPEFAALLVASALAACGSLVGNASEPTPVTAADAGDAATPDSGTTSFCDRNKDAIFCEDFDDHTNKLTQGLSQLGNATPVVGIEDGLGTGGTPGLHFKLVTGDASTVQNITYELPLAVDAPQDHAYRLELDVYLRAFDVTYGVLAGFRGGNQKVYGAGANRQGDFSLFDAVDNSGYRPPTFYGTWHHVLLAIEGSGATHSLAMTVDGNPLTVPANPDVSEAPTLLIGNFYGSGLVDADQVFDNIVVRVE